MNRLKPRYWYGLDKHINPMGLGCWQLSGNYLVNGNQNGWGFVDDSVAIRIIHHALDNGIEFYDTASGYGNGKSESLLGKAFSTSSIDATICSKIPLSDSDVTRHKIGKSFIKNVDLSLKRLKRDRIDILLVHNPPDDLDWNQFDVDSIRKLQADGKIGTFGISSRSFSGVTNALEAGFGTCIEWVFNLLERRPENVFNSFEEQKMNFIARSPLSRGFLTRKYLNQKPNFGVNDFRNKLPQDWIDWINSSVNLLDLSGYELQHLATLALQYCLRFPQVSAIIPGTKRLGQLEEYLELEVENLLSDGFILKLGERTDYCYPLWK